MRVVGVLFVALLLCGCASAYRRGETALLEGRYTEATGHFRDALARDQSVLDASIGLGISSYKLGALDDAIENLRRAVGHASDSLDARLYLALSYLRTKQDGLAEEQLRAFSALNPDRRLGALVERALELLHAGTLTEEVRAFVTLALDDAASWARDVRALNEQLRYASVPVFPAYYPEIIFVPVRH